MSDTAAQKTGVLVMAHGTPADPSGIEAFYTRIRHGRPPSPEQLADLVRRYDAIGGTSPLGARTEAQVAGVTAALDACEPGRFAVRFGAKHTDPSIEDAALELAALGASEVVGVVLTPHRASLGSDEYLDRAAAALESVPRPPRFVRVPQWYDAPGFAALVAERVRTALDALGAAGRAGRTTVLFSAHSLPARVVATGDPYPEQVAASAAAAAELAGLGARDVAWEVAWQSAGRTPEPWIGPDLLASIRRLGEEARTASAHAAVVVCPIGFVADHLEVLYDVDIEARTVADAEGLAFSRTASPNDDPLLAAVVAGAVRAALRTAGTAGAAGTRSAG